jgi:potassium inwardly-rectifying channel subfamily J
VFISLSDIKFFSRFPTEECESGIILLAIQSIVGTIIQAWMAGIIFAKFTVPRNRGQTIVFSKNAVISLRNGALHLMCRITDFRKYSLLDARVQVNRITFNDSHKQ